MAKRWARRRELPGLWEVYEIETGIVVHVEGCPLNGLDKDEADELVMLLEAGEVFPDERGDT